MKAQGLVATQLLEPDPAFSAALTGGKRAEVAEKNYPRAISFYRQASEIYRAIKPRPLKFYSFGDILRRA